MLNPDGSVVIGNTTTGNVTLNSGDQPNALSIPGRARMALTISGHLDLRDYGIFTVGGERIAVVQR